MDIILTDWPKTRHAKANLRGMETDDLFDKGKNLFHGMMTFGSDFAGGYYLDYTLKEIEEELKFRKDARLENYLNGKL